MSPTFAERCQADRRQDAITCFERGMCLNRLAHSPGVAGRRTCFAFKTRASEHAIGLLPDEIVVDEFRPLSGIVGITFRGVGKVHLKYRSRRDETKRWVWQQLRLDERCTLPSAA